MLITCHAPHITVTHRAPRRLTPRCFLVINHTPFASVCGCVNTASFGGNGYMTLHISAVSSLMTVLVTSALAFTDLAGGAAGIAKSAPASGEWVKVDTIEISELTVYAEDPSTLHREGNLVKMWA